MADAHIASLGELAGWLVQARERIQAQVHVREKKRGSGKATIVSIDHRLPCELEAYEGWHVQTAATFLPRDHFSSQVRSYVNSAERSRGRAIFCLDSAEGEVVAAIAYHIEAAGLPLLVTTLGFRLDSVNNPSLRLRTLAGALVLKHHAHAIADKIGRGGHIDMDLADKANLGLASDFGFQRAPKVRGFRPGGVHLRQPAPS